MKINIGNDLYLKGRIGWKGLSKDEYLSDSNYRIINGYSLKDGYIDWEIAGFISKERYEESPEIMLKVDDILISKDGTIGKVGIVRNLVSPTTVASGIFVLRNIIEDKLDTEYLFQYLKSSYFKSFINSVKAEGSTINHLYQRDLIRLEIDVPKIDLQRKIAKVLSDLDAKIELNNRINRELEAMAKTLYDYWFVQFDFPNEQGKPYKSSGGKMVYNAELKREIPEGWEVKTLLDIATYINGFACQNYRPTNEDYLPVIKIREMRDGITESTEKVKADIPNKLIVNDGDVLFSWSASLEVMIWSGGKGGLNQHIFKVTSKKYPRSFYYYQLIWYLQHFKMIAELRKTTMGHITQDHLKQSRIVIPPIEIVKALDEKLYPIQEKQILLHKQNQQLSALRDWLLPMLMNGQVTVKQAEEKLSMAAEPSVEYKTK